MAVAPVNPENIPKVAIAGLSWGAAGNWATFTLLLSIVGLIVKRVGPREILELLFKRAKELRDEKVVEDTGLLARIERLEDRAQRAETVSLYLGNAITITLDELRSSDPANPAIKRANDMIEMAIAAGGDSFFCKGAGQAGAGKGNRRMSRQPPSAIIASAQASQRATKALYNVEIPASVTMAQVIQEGGWDFTPSGKNNLGGITAKVKGATFPFKPGTPLEPATLCWTHENWQGKRVSCQRWFKDFPSLEAFFTAHAKLLATGAPYAHARTLLPDPIKFVHALTGVYATAPNYGDSLAAIIQGSNLTRFDR